MSEIKLKLDKDDWLDLSLEERATKLNQLLTKLSKKNDPAITKQIMNILEWERDNDND